MFHFLHLMFENQYKELWLAADALAKRIRALVFLAPGSDQELSKLTRIRETQGIPTDAGMVAELLSDHESCARAARQALWIAPSSIDAPIEDFLTQRLMAHEHIVWMLNSFTSRRYTCNHASSGLRLDQLSKLTAMKDCAEVADDKRAIDRWENDDRKCVSGEG